MLDIRLVPDIRLQQVPDIRLQQMLNIRLQQVLDIRLPSPRDPGLPSARPQLPGLQARLHHGVHDLYHIYLSIYLYIDK